MKTSPEPVKSIRQFLQMLRATGEVADIRVPVDPNLELAEIHRRVVADGGPALLFHDVKGSKIPVVTNLFGTLDRVERSFGPRPKHFISRVVEAAHTLLPPTPAKLWGFRDMAWEGLAVGMRRRSGGPVTEVIEEDVDLTKLPALTSWHSDGGPFVTLPLVYTESPTSGKGNLGMYRMHIHSRRMTGMHFQIGKGGGFHLHEAEQRGQDLPATVFLGGPPALVLSAIAPLPEDVPELVLCSLLLGERLTRVHHRDMPHPLIADAEMAFVGRVLAGERHPEGPFGDHYGYNSLEENYPVFEVDKICRRNDPIWPATVVGRPRQEDFYIGDFLQDLLSPLFPLVMPSVKGLWSYGETGFHSLSAAVVTDRYPREAVASGFRILGEGQLSLSKMLILTDQPVDLKDFRAVLETFLERVDWSTDLLVFDHVSQDSLDYTGPKVHRGSKALFLGLGEKKRDLPGELTVDLPPEIKDARVLQPGCLVVRGPDYADDAEAAQKIAELDQLADWPLIVLVDDVDEATASTELFLWTTFTRMAPAADIHGRPAQVGRFHVGLQCPVVFDCRMKPWYPEVMAVDAETKELVDRRWGEYGLEQAGVS